MSVSVNVEIKNLPAFRRAMHDSPTIVKPRLDKAIKTGILLISRTSKQNTPVDTGRLRASTQEVFRPLYGEVGTHVNYDIFVHEGTRFMKARPFLRNAYDENKALINEVFERELKGAMDDISRKV